MMASEMLEGHKISIIVDELNFDSQICIIRDEYILIELIVVDNKIVSFPPNIKIDMVYYNDDNKLFLWENIAVTPVMFKDGNKYHKVVMSSKEGQKYNRRGDFRIYVGEHMRVDIRKGTYRNSINTTIKDISASGFAFVNEQDFEIGQKVTLHYEAGRGKIFDFPGKIVRKQYMENIKSSIYGCSINDSTGLMRKIVASIQQKKLSEKYGNNTSRDTKK